MQLRTFLAKDMKEALSSVRREMGTDAVIVASERAKDGSIMVRAALERSETQAPAAPEEPHEAPADSIPQDFSARHRDSLIRRLRHGTATTEAAARSFDRAQLLQLLRAHRAPDALAHDLAMIAEQSGLSDMTLALACALDRRMRAAPLDIVNATAFLLTGPNGAGKTATAAKIAAHARLSGRKVALIGADAEGAGAAARLQTFALHLGADFVLADSADAIVKSVARACGGDALAIVDTMGFDPRQSKMRAAFAALAAVDGIEPIALLSSSCDAEEAGEMAASLAQLGAQRLIVTGLDLVRRLGALVSAASQGLALAQVTRSPYVAGGLETLTPLSLARLLIAADARDADQGSPQ